MAINPFRKGGNDTIPVTEGGTGATSGAAALSNLGGLSSGAHAILNHSGIPGVGDLTSAAHAILNHSSVPGVPNLQSAHYRSTNVTNATINPGFTPLFGVFIHTTNYNFIELMGSIGVFKGTSTLYNACLYSGGLSNGTEHSVCAVARNGSRWRCTSFTSSNVTVARTVGGDVLGEVTMIVIGY